MPEYVRRVELAVTIDGYDVAGYFAPYLLDFSFKDEAGGKSDEVQIGLHNKDGRFSGEWRPKKGMEVTAAIICHDWEGQGDEQTLPCGSFTIDEVTLSGPPDKIQIKAVSASLTGNLRDTQKTRAWENTTLGGVAGQIAGDNGLALSFYRTGGRGSKQIEEPLGRASAGWTESRCNNERAARINGITPSNTEARAVHKKPTFAELWHLYADAHAANASLKDDDIRYRLHLEKRLGKICGEDLKTADIVAVRKCAEKAGLSPQTVKYIVALVRKVMRYAERSGACPVPQGLVFDLPAVDSRKTEDMTRAQLKAYWKALDEEPDQQAAALLKLAMLTGMRRSALFGLMWDDIDLDRNVIRLRGENAKSGRTAFIPLNEAAKAVLGKLVKVSAYVFPGRDGGKRQAFSKIARRVRDRAGLPKDFRPLHGLRHVFASSLASSGQVDIYTLQRLLTHGSPQMTQRYAHLRDEALAKAAAVANSLAGGKDER